MPKGKRRQVRSGQLWRIELKNAKVRVRVGSQWVADLPAEPSDVLSITRMSDSKLVIAMTCNEVLVVDTMTGAVDRLK